MDNPIMDNQMMNNQMMNNQMMNNQMMNNPIMINQMMNNPIMINQMMNNLMMNSQMMNNQMMNDPIMISQMMNNEIMNNQMINNPIMYNPMINNPIMNNQMINNPIMNNPVMNNQIMNNQVMNTIMNEQIMNYPMMMINNQNNDDIQFNEIKIMNEFRRQKMNEFFEIIKNHNNYNDNKANNKIIINYYNIIKKEIYVDLRKEIAELIFDLYNSIGIGINKEIFSVLKEYKRENESETTKFIFENPKFKVVLTKSFVRCLNKFLYLEYNNKNLTIDGKETGLDLGIKDGEVIFLKLDENYIKECALERNINIIFKLIRKNELKPIVINCARNEYFPNLVDKLIINKNLNDIEEIKFIFNSKELGYNFTLEEIGITNNSNIYIFDRIEVKGAGGSFGPGIFDFVDVSSGKIKSLELGENELNWRIVEKGLNIFGICNNPDCKAFKKEVVCPFLLEKKMKFSLKKEILKINCPICKKIIKPKTCGFRDCEYQFVGTRIKEGNINNYESKPKETKINELEYFDPYENGEEGWIDLIIYVLPKQIIKYKDKKD